jgi:hypothetical protein
MMVSHPGGESWFVWVDIYFVHYVGSVGYHIIDWMAYQLLTVEIVRLQGWISLMAVIVGELPYGEEFKLQKRLGMCGKEGEYKDDAAQGCG